MIHPNELTQMLLDAGFPYSMDTLHNMDKFQKLLAMEREHCAKIADAKASHIASSFLEKYAATFISDGIRARGSNV